MTDYEALFHILVNAVYDAVNLLDEGDIASAKRLLIEAQKDVSEREALAHRPPEN